MSEWTSHRHPVLTHKSLKFIQDKLASKDTGISELSITLDLKQTEDTITLDHDKQVFIIGDYEIKIPDSFDSSNPGCYFINEVDIYPISVFSDETNMYYKLVPTKHGRPILRISATQMHKKPFLDFIERKRPKGNILDAGTGLGYSAILVSEYAKKVTTVEWDYNVIEVASHNPHSWKLFESENIILLNEDITELIKTFADNSYDNIIADGGMPKSSGQFFSQAHANELYRVIKPRGHVFFYLPKKGLKTGRDFGLEQIKRMQKAGFKTQIRDIEGSYAYFLKN
jgi:predicted methyltransferase